MTLYGRSLLARSALFIFLWLESFVKTKIGRNSWPCIWNFYAYHFRYIFTNIPLLTSFNTIKSLFDIEYQDHVSEDEICFCWGPVFKVWLHTNCSHVVVFWARPEIFKQVGWNGLWFNIFHFGKPPRTPWLPYNYHDHLYPVKLRDVHHGPNDEDYEQ